MAVKARLVEEPMSNRVRLFIYTLTEDGDAICMGPQGKVKVPEGTVPPEEAGYSFPAYTIEAIAEAIDRWNGKWNDAKTEAFVLRQWLEHEQGRVDLILHRSVTWEKE